MLLFAIGGYFASCLPPESYILTQLYRADLYGRRDLFRTQQRFIRNFGIFTHYHHYIWIQ